MFQWLIDWLERDEGNLGATDGEFTEAEMDENRAALDRHFDAVERRYYGED